jgi:pimeloyl-ACP methyl ester carboxylesterase
MPYELPPDPRTERRARISRWVSFIVAALLIALIAYLGYVGYEGSSQLAEPPNPSADCRTPAAFGWTYEAINYDVTTDAELIAEADPQNCTREGAPAGIALASTDGISLAGWYIPAGNGSGPTAPTVILSHGWGSNKSNMLDRAAFIHDQYNVVIFDYRNHGQSSDGVTTQGVLEQADLRAVIDWVSTAKAPEQIAVFGVSMGGAIAASQADRDERVDAVILESTHATLATAIQARLDRSGYPLSMPGSWAILLGGLVRTGQDMSAADPIQAVARLDGRPLLLIYGGADDAIAPNDAEEMLAAAEAAETPAELHVCEAAEHAKSWEACASDYGSWVLGFLQRTIGPTG